MIRRCTPGDVDAIYTIVNDAAQAYQDVIPPDRWRVPYMPRQELLREIAQGVVFWGMEQESRMVGVMGIQDKGDVTLIRHAYVRSASRNQGIGTALLRHLETLSHKPILVGTWSAASWAIAFYRKQGYQLVSLEETQRLLKKYWSIPERQVQTSVVLAKGPQTNRTVNPESFGRRINRQTN